VSPVQITNVNKMMANHVVQIHVVRYKSSLIQVIVRDVVNMR
jgi:hypothetical protein